MSSAELSSGAEKAVELSRRRQTLITGWVLLLLAVFVAVVFGLGSSGSFTTALLKALYTQRKRHLHQEELAELACHIEIDRLAQPIGK